MINDIFPLALKFYTKTRLCSFNILGSFDVYSTYEEKTVYKRNKIRTNYNINVKNVNFCRSVLLPSMSETVKCINLPHINESINLLVMST